MWSFPLFPESASTLSGRVDAVYFVVIGISIFFTALIALLVTFFAIRYRKGSDVDRSHPVSHNIKLELLWIVGPLGIVMVIFVLGMQVFFEMFNPPKNASDIYVVGKQWMWKVRHPQGRSEINEIHLPAGKPVRLLMTSQDVIHSFYIPAFRMKQDVLPGRLTSAWFEPTKPGRYHLFCAEYCGTDHSRMGGWAVVMEPAEYEKWLKGPNGDGSDSRPTMASEGARLFEKYHCTGCHGENSEFRAPKLAGVYGGQVPVMDGKDVTFVTADDMYIRDSILLPKSKVVAGFEPVMPSYQDVLKEDELLQIMEYIKSIGRKEGTAK
ncbi:cytochrome c oxidase subunit II [Tundrisphaera sp. TA3]|uniref:cytochrome c oxidase subunit II n=1 Tax=Tundrisphaera sp. TA3 TaxID=3435775 RepID=UPI003EBE9A49